MTVRDWFGYRRDPVLVYSPHSDTYRIVSSPAPYDVVLEKFVLLEDFCRLIGCRPHDNTADLRLLLEYWYHV